QRPATLGAPGPDPQTLGQPGDDLRVRRLLQDDEIRLPGCDDRGERRLAAESSVADVVGQDRQRHEPGARPTRTRYGWPSTSPRSVITASRVAWMLTGRCTIAISRS